LRLSAFALFLTGCFAAASYAAEPVSPEQNSPKLELKPLSGFFRLNYDNIKMPGNNQRMGLVGLNYFADFTPTIYGGVGVYGAVQGNQGGLFVLGIGAGVHHPISEHWWVDAGMYVGGGGGRASMVGGGLMLRPNVGVAYDFRWAKLGLHYSYVDFPSGDIRSSQIGLDFDFPYDFYYVNYSDVSHAVYGLDQIQLLNGKFLTVERNDLGIFLQAYFQKKGTKNNGGQVQDNTIGLIGAELDHYFTENTFFSFRTDGAYSGIPNGYMDILMGLGYHWSFGPYGFALVPQFDLGAGGGGSVDTGGGVLVHPMLGFELPMTASFSARLNGGYLWAPQGSLKAPTLMGEFIYHMDLMSGGSKPYENTSRYFDTQGWRFQVFNQTYVHPQRVNESTTSPNNLIGIQLDQFITPNVFFSYQAASAYSGVHAGGLATGMLGPGIQTNELKYHLQPFAEILIGAGGGGGLQIGGGAIIEPVVGVHYLVNQNIGLVGSLGQLVAMRNHLNTPVVNLGVTVRFGTLG
jgi:hypothetical protein